MKLLDTFFNTFKTSLVRYFIRPLLHFYIFISHILCSDFRFFCLFCGCLNLSHSNTNRSFPAFCFDVRCHCISFALKAGCFLAATIAAHSLASTSPFFLGLCFKAFWCSFSLALKAGLCLASFFLHIHLLIHLDSSWLPAYKHVAVLFHLL